MTREQTPCRGEVLMSTRDCLIFLCGCGAYHVRIGAVTLHLTAVQFFEVARVFKFMMGRVAGLAPSAPAAAGDAYVGGKIMREASGLPDPLSGE